jgi:mannose-1-phosphate guanylyltransferase
MTKPELTTHAIILAGGRGTRFWPRSRARTPKQLLNIVGKTTMFEQTIARIRPLLPVDHIWSVTNIELALALGKQLPAPARKRVLPEPVGRNTTAAIALAAIHVRHEVNGDALLAVLPADHNVSRPDIYREVFRIALQLACEPGRMLMLGIPPTRPDTGYGYVEKMGEPRVVQGYPVYAVRRFTEKPQVELAKEYVASGNYLWNAGMFFWRVSTFLEALRNHLPKTHDALESLALHIGKRSYGAALKRIYSKLENISVDFAILERATRQEDEERVFIIPADIGWSDIGSWAAVCELVARQPGENVLAGDGHTIDSSGNFLWSPDKFVAAIGVHNLIVVDTPDALLICPRERAQEVGKIVKALEEKKGKNLL